MHLWSSTAEFTLSSPLPKTTVEITSINATAFYEKSEPIGRIDYHQPFDVPPGISQSPRLPVDLHLGSIGYDALKNALGGSLKMCAVAEVGVRVHNYTDMITYRGKGISAHVRI